MFKVGDEVVCVDALTNWIGKYGIVRGAVYKVVAFCLCYKCGRESMSVTTDRPHRKTKCWSCGAVSDGIWYRKSRFVKLPREKIDSTEPEAMPIEVE